MQEAIMQKAIHIVNDWIVLNDPTAQLVLESLGLENLPPIPINCQILKCNYNKLIYLPELPNCKELGCTGNSLIYLPELPNCKDLSCGGNILESLPKLPNCQILNCCNNILTTLPQLPNCEYLYCDKNSLTVFPELPNCRRLYCNDNKLIALPSLPKCQKLSCNGNKYLHINKKLATKFNLTPTLNYNKYAKKIQRTYRNYIRRKHKPFLDEFLFNGPAKIVCLYVI